MKEEILKIIKENNLSVSKYYMYENGSLIKKYKFDNYSDSFIYDNYFLTLNLSLDKIAEIAYNALEIQYSQEHEFYLD